MANRMAMLLRQIETRRAAEEDGGEGVGSVLKHLPFVPGLIGAIMEGDEEAIGRKGGQILGALAGLPGGPPGIAAGREIGAQLGGSIGGSIGGGVAAEEEEERLTRQARQAAALMALDEEYAPRASSRSRPLWRRPGRRRGGGLY